MRTLAASYRRDSFRVFHEKTLSTTTFKRPLLATYWTDTTVQNKMQYITTLYGTTRRLFSPCSGERGKTEKKQIALDRGRAIGATEAGTFFLSLAVSSFVPEHRREELPPGAPPLKTPLPPKPGTTGTMVQTLSTYMIYIQFLTTGCSRKRFRAKVTMGTSCG